MKACYVFLLSAICSGLFFEIVAAPFTDHGNGTVEDAATGLLWTKCSMGGPGNQPANGTGFDCSGAPVYLSWQAALQACEDLAFAGRTDWRLPNINELKSIIDYAVLGPTFDASVFPNTPPTSRYWSSTTFAATPSAAWIVLSFYGNVNSDSKASAVHVRCVRGP